MIKSVHIVPSIYDEASGISYCVPKFCDALAGRDVEVELHVLSPIPERFGQTYDIHAHHAWPFVRRLGISPRMRTALAKAEKTASDWLRAKLWRTVYLPS